MRSLPQVLVRVCAIAALVLIVGACSNVTTPRVLEDRGGAWPGWQDIDEGGFEQMGTVTWQEGVFADASVGSKTVTSVQGGVVATYQVDSYTQQKVNYQFFPARSCLSNFLYPPQKYIRISAVGNVANLTVLDRAAASGGTVHISGRQMSGLRGGAGYVDVHRATPVKRPVRIAW